MVEPASAGRAASKAATLAAKKVLASTLDDASYLRGKQRDLLELIDERCDVIHSVLLNARPDSNLGRVTMPDELTAARDDLARARARLGEPGFFEKIFGRASANRRKAIKTSAGLAEKATTTLITAWTTATWSRNSYDSYRDVKREELFDLDNPDERFFKLADATNTADREAESALAACRRDIDALRASLNAYYSGNKS
jgi:hypothetical protein